MEASKGRRMSKRKMKDTNDEPIYTIKYEEKIDENVIFLDDDHENEICKRIDTLTLDKPIFIIRKDPDTGADQGLPMTERILNFLKENKDKDLDYCIYINYSFACRNAIKEMEHNEDIAYYDKISEDDFIEGEKAWWIEAKELEEKYANEPDPILNAIKAFHNMKWHNGEEYYKYDRGEGQE